MFRENIFTCDFFGKCMQRLFCLFYQNNYFLCPVMHNFRNHFYRKVVATSVISSTSRYLSFALNFFLFYLKTNINKSNEEFIKISW